MTRLIGYCRHVWTGWYDTGVATNRWKQRHCQRCPAVEVRQF